MSKLSDYIASQFAEPRGIVGKITCICMTIINKKMYLAVNENVTGYGPILEIGYGNGYLISLLYKKMNSKIYGIDISADMKNAATKRNRQGVNLGDIDLAEGDCCSLSFENEF